MHIHIVPMGKPRMTQRDRWAHRPVVNRYHAFCDELRLQFNGTLTDRVEINFYMPMPPSWSKKKRAMMSGAPHQQRPDIDNLLKAVFDALCAEDSHIYEVKASKYWAEEPGISIANS